MYLYPPMKVSENTLKWAMRFYPPLFFQRIWTRKFNPGFRGVEVHVSPCILNKNYNGSVFGGSLFSAADPFYAVLFDQIFRRKGHQTRIWLKRAEIDYIKPVVTRVHFKICLTEADIAEAEHGLLEQGTFTKTFHIEMKDRSGQVYVRIQQRIYLRLLKETTVIKQINHHE